MYYQLTGELIHTEAGAAVLDCGGVGYYLNVSSNTLARISGKRGERVRLFTHLSVKEDALELFGFFEYSELTAFRMLLGVSGVGAKTALAVMSALSPEGFASAVLNEDARALKAPGVGAKTAARIILELKDKVSKELSSGGDGLPVGNASGTGAKSTLEDALSTLLVLGYTRGEASAALRGIDTNLTLEECIRAALKKLGGA